MLLRLLSSTMYSCHKISLAMSTAHTTPSESIMPLRIPFITHYKRSSHMIFRYLVADHRHHIIGTSLRVMMAIVMVKWCWDILMHELYIMQHFKGLNHPSNNQWHHHRLHPKCYNWRYSGPDIYSEQCLLTDYTFRKQLIFLKWANMNDLKISVQKKLENNYWGGIGHLH